MRKTNGQKVFPKPFFSVDRISPRRLELIVDRWGYIERALRDILALMLNIKTDEAFSLLHALHSFKGRLDILKATGTHARYESQDGITQSF